MLARPGRGRSARAGRPGPTQPGAQAGRGWRVVVPARRARHPARVRIPARRPILPAGRLLQALSRRSHLRRCHEHRRSGPARALDQRRARRGLEKHERARGRCGRLCRRLRSLRRLGWSGTQTFERMYR